MAILGPIVEPPPHFSSLEIAEFTHCCGVRIEAIGEDLLGLAVSLEPLFQQAQSRSFVSFLCHIALENLAFMINDTPKIMGLTIDLYDDVIEVPPPICGASHPANPLAANVGGKHWTETVSPEADGLVADIDTAFDDQILYIPQAEWKANVHQNHETDHLRRRVEVAQWTWWFGSGFAADRRKLASHRSDCHVGLTRPANSIRCI